MQMIDNLRAFDELERKGFNIMGQLVTLKHVSAGFHTGFLEKGVKPSGAPHLPGNSAYYQYFDS